MATVYRRNETYWIRFAWRGKEVRRSAHTNVKSVAQQYLAQVLEEYRRLDRGGRPRRTYQEALERFHSEYLPSLKPATQSRYRVSLKKLAPFFGGLYLDEITKGRLADYVSERRKARVTGATIRRDLSTLSCLCSFAIALDMIEVNPVKQFSRRHIREAAPRTSYPSDTEIERLVAIAPPMMGRAIRFLAETGMRMEEAISLEWSQVSLHRREIRLTKTKTSSPRVVPLSQAAYDSLMGTPRHPTSPYIFWHSGGDRFRQFSGHFRRLAKRIGFKYRAHDLRHRYASVFLQATGDLAALQAVLGHKTIEMTMRYSHLITEHLHYAIAKAGTKLGTRASGFVEDRTTHGNTGYPDASLSTSPFCWTVTAKLEKDCSFKAVVELNPKGSGTVSETVLNPLVSRGPVAQQDRAAVS